MIEATLYNMTSEDPPPPTAIIEPFLEPLDTAGNYILPTTQYIANAAILVVFAYLIPLIVMEVNYFRYAVWRSHGRLVRRKEVVGGDVVKEESVTMEEEGVKAGSVVVETKKEGSSSSAGRRSTRNDEENQRDIVIQNLTSSVSSDDISAVVAGEENRDDNDRKNGHHQGGEELLVEKINSCYNTIIQEKKNNDDNDDDDDDDYDRNQSQTKNDNNNNNHLLQDTSRHSAVGHLMHDVRSMSVRSTVVPDVISRRNSRRLSTTSINNKHTKSNTHDINQTASDQQQQLLLHNAYKCIQTSSLISIILSLLIYTISATLIALYTRNMESKMVAVVTGSSKFVAAVIVFILSAKVPQWIGVYHQGKIRLAHCSSNYSIQFIHMDISDPTYMTKLSRHVKLGVAFHFAKFYIPLLPFYCGVRPITIPFSIITGSITGFVLMWCVFLVHERYIDRRNIVAFITVFICAVMSSLLFVRGMAWIQVIWDLAIFHNEDAVLVTSFFGWLIFIMGVHALFIWHTVRMEKLYRDDEDEDVVGDVGLRSSGEGNAATATVGVGGSGTTTAASGGGGTMLANLSTHSSTKSGRRRPRRRRSSSNSAGDGNDDHHVDTNGDVDGFKRTKSYDSFLFDPRFLDDSFKLIDKDGGSDHHHHYDPRLYGNESKEVGLSPSRSCHALPSFLYSHDEENDNDDDDNEPVVIESSSSSSEEEAIERNGTGGGVWKCHRRQHRPEWCQIFTCFRPEYKKVPFFWKLIGWVKIMVIATSYILCLYFVIVALGATHQITNTRRNLPAVRKILYETQNEREVCAFDNRGAASNITTFVNKDAAHDAGFLVLHCGACAACSTWENLVIQYTTRHNLAASANKCAMRGFLGGQDAITECIKEPAIGFTGQCAECWSEDIVCTREHCAFIFLQSQITNSVTNFRVSPDDITAATCEEAHCEVGAFVPCVGATRRRMNIISSIARPVEEQCRIVDVDWEELFAEYL